MLRQGTYRLSMKDFFWRLYKRYRIWYYSLRPTYALMIGYTMYVLVTFFLLSLPLCRKINDVPFIDSLFTAIAVITTTGLQCIDFSETYNTLGQVVILLGLQIGGMGYMTLGSLIIIASKGHLPKNRVKIGKAVLAFPETFDTNRFLKHIFVFTVSIETIGALILWFLFWTADIPNPLWAGVFHSVSAFCTAGVSIFPNNLENFADHSAICLTISLLCLLGGLGFIVLDDFYRSIQSRKVKATLTTRIVLVATFGAIAAGTFFFFFDPHFAEFPLKKRILTSLFQAVAALTTAGFNTVPISNLTAASAVIFMILMTLGASPSGTGGGLKTTTWSAAIASILCFFHGREEITFFNNKVPHGRITAAFAAITLYMIIFALGTYFLLLVETHPFEYVVFEAVAALGTVGLSHGITPDLTVQGKVIIMIMMYIGRLGVVALALGAVALYQDIMSEVKVELNPKVKPELPSSPPIKEDDIVL